METHLRLLQKEDEAPPPIPETTHENAGKRRE